MNGYPDSLLVNFTGNMRMKRTLPSDRPFHFWYIVKKHKTNLSEGDNKRINTPGETNVSSNAHSFDCGRGINYGGPIVLTYEQKGSSNTTSVGEGNPGRETGKRSVTVRRAARKQRHWRKDTGC